MVDSPVVWVDEERRLHGVGCVATDGERHDCSPGIVAREVVVAPLCAAPRWVAAALVTVVV